MSQCAACTAAWGDLGLDCSDRHTQQHLQLADALADAFNPAPANADLLNRLIHAGWFMEDAEDILASGLVVGPPFRVSVISLDEPVKFSVNGRFCEAYDGEKSRGFVRVFGRSA